VELERESREAPVATIQPSTVNYVLVAIIFLFLGVLIGAIGYERFAQANAANTDALINRAVATAVAAVPRGDTAQAQPDPDVPVNVSTEGDPSMGPADAPIVMVEFGDFRCGFCKRFHDETLTPLLAQYEGQIRYVFRDYPLLGEDSYFSAVAAECADDQGEFWAFRDWLFAHQDQLNRDAFITLAGDLELDVATFTTCFDEQTHREEIVQDYAEGQQLGVGGTPTFFINGRVLVGAQPLTQFQMRIDAELAQAADSSAS
jgi:protein-disulfide isomerase